jgi:hypothetical protein
MSITFWNPENPAKFVEKYDPGYEELYSVMTDDSGIEINMCNSNALEVLSLLSLPSDYSGKISARELEVLCKRALIRLRNSSFLDKMIPTVIKGNFIDTGRPEGYLQNTIIKLLEMAQQRTTEYDEIYWG